MTELTTTAVGYENAADNSDGEGAMLLFHQGRAQAAAARRDGRAGRVAPARRRRRPG